MLKVKEFIKKYKSGKLNLSGCALDSKKLEQLGTPDVRKFLIYFLNNRGDTIGAPIESNVIDTFPQTIIFKSEVWCIPDG